MAQRAALREAASEARKTLAARSVHVKVVPRIGDVRESREVLRVLKGFGEVVSFRNLRYDSSAPAANTILAIYQHSEAATKLIEASPFRFAIEPAPKSELLPSGVKPGLLQAIKDVTELSQTPAAGSNDSEAAGAQRSNKKDLEDTPREFLLTADVSLRNHQGFIQRKGYYWGHENRFGNYALEDLSRSVPVEGMAVLSLEWSECPQHIIDKRLSEIASRKTLRQLWNEGMESAAG